MSSAQETGSQVKPHWHHNPDWPVARIARRSIQSLQRETVFPAVSSKPAKENFPILEIALTHLAI